MTKTYCVLKGFPGHAVGSEHDFDEADAAEYVREGKLLEKSAKDAKEVENEVSDAVGGVASTILKEILKQLKTVSKGASPLAGLSVPENDPARVKDAKSLGELLQAGAWLGSGRHFPHLQEKGYNLLKHKYEAIEKGISSTFNNNWDASTKMQGDADDVTKASAQVEDVGALGGFFVKPEFSATVFELMDFNSALVAAVTKRVVTAKDWYEPTKDYSLGGSGASPYLAGMTGAWLPESATFPQTQMNVRQIHLSMNLFGAYTVVSVQLLRDNSYAFEQMMVGNFAATAAFYLAKAIFNGPGGNQPHGFANATAAIGTNRTSGAGGLFGNLATMVSLMLPDEGAKQRYFWMISPAKAALIQLNDTTGRLIYMPNFPSMDRGTATVQVPMLLFGMPVVVSQFPASSGSSTDFVLVDPSVYLLGLRQDLEVASSEHVNFLSYQMTYRWLMRADGQSAINTYLTLQNGDTVSPFLFLN